MLSSHKALLIRVWERQIACFYLDLFIWLWFSLQKSVKGLFITCFIYTWEKMRVLLTWLTASPLRYHRLCVSERSYWYYSWHLIPHRFICIQSKNALAKFPFDLSLVTLGWPQTVQEKSLWVFNVYFQIVLILLILCLASIFATNV